MKKIIITLSLAASLTAFVPFSYGDLNLTPLLQASDFSNSTAGRYPQVSASLSGPLPSTVYFDIELVNISNLNSQYGSFFGSGFLNSGSILGEYQFHADTDSGATDGMFGALLANNGGASSIVHSGGFAEGTRVWLKLEVDGDTVSADVIDQADDTILASASYSMPGASTADTIFFRTYDNEGIISPSLVTGGAEDYWELRATRTGVDTTARLYGVSIPEPSTLAFVGIFGGGLWLVRKFFPVV